MANYTLITNTKMYIGASTDTRPTTGIPAGSLAFETDTGILYILHGSTWYVYEGILKFTPSTAQVIDAAGDVILANATMVVLNPDADHTLTSTPTIADGVTGQILILTCANNEAHTVTIQDQDTLGSSNLQLLASTRAITGKMGCVLYFDGSDWIELGSDEFASIVISGLTASRLVSTSATKALESSDATAWIAGTANQITVTDDTDGSVTLSTPQDIAAASSPSFAGITLTGTSIYTPSTTQVIDAVGDAILANATLVVLNPDADHTLTSTPTIADGTLGQVLYITCANGEAHTVTIQDQDTLGSSNLQLLSSTKAITGKTVCTLVFDGTDWVEYGGGGAGNTTIELPVGDATVYADGAANAGVVTQVHDNTNFVSFLRWTSATATQDIDFVWEFKLPSDFASFGTDALSVSIRTNDKDANVANLSMYEADGTVDSGVNAVSILPSANDVWEIATDTPADSYSAGDAIRVIAHCGNDAASDTVDIARVFLTYSI